MSEKIGHATRGVTPVCFIVHGLSHLRAALTAGAECGRPIVALSGPAASAYAGAAWFQALMDQGRAEFPQVKLSGVLDCGDRAGDALAALQSGVTGIVFTGHPNALTRLQAIAAESRARVHERRPDGFDLLNQQNPLFAARRHCGLPP